VIEFNDENFENHIDFDQSKLELIKHKQYQIYLRHLNNLDKRCRNILDLFFKGLGFSSIVDTLKIKNTGYAYKLKHDCIKTLMANIKNDREYSPLNDDDYD
jgi:DNA-directed RNA polymerase specialized sigma subunit